MMILVLTFFPVILITANGRSTSTSFAFCVIPLGTSGGLSEDNLSSYLLTSVDDNMLNSTYIVLDGGTIRNGLEYSRIVFCSSFDFSLFLFLE